MKYGAAAWAIIFLGLSSSAQAITMNGRDAFIEPVRASLAGLPPDIDATAFAEMAVVEAGWRVGEADATGFKALIRVRDKHEVTVHVRYSRTELVIDYVDSSNMRFQPECQVEVDRPANEARDHNVFYVRTGSCIHRNYYNWVNWIVEAAEKGAARIELLRRNPSLNTAPALAVQPAAKP